MTTPIDDQIRLLLTAGTRADDRAFRLRVMESICARQQRLAALRRQGVVVGTFAMVGVSIALLAQTAEGVAILEPLALAVCLCGVALELAGWLIEGRSLAGSAFR